MQPTGQLDLALPNDRELEFTRMFNAPREMIWACNTKPDLVRRWLLGPPGWSMPVCEIDLRVGGRYRYVWRHEDGREMGMGGVYSEVSAPERLVSTEMFDDNWTGGETLNTLVFSEVGARTVMTLNVRYATKETRDAAMQSGMMGGMEAGYSRLDDMLAER